MSHDRSFLDRICTCMLAAERRLDPDPVDPKRIKYKKLAR